MKMNLNVLSDKPIDSTTSTRNMRLSENAEAMVFQMFTRSVYSNPIGTVVREITSNCFDSHVEAGVDLPVLIKKSYDGETDTHYISFIDFGMGLSPDRVNNIYTVYFESTKRSDNTQIGGFGIGSKTPLAYIRKTGMGSNDYDNSFYVITRYEGIEYNYCIYEGSSSPVITLLHSEPTDERNGTEIRIPILQSDLSKFEKEIKRQLYYFENLVFEGFNNIDNQYSIVKGEHFLYRGTYYSDNMHICLGRVAYPIDFNIIGYDNRYSLPIALRFEVGELNVVASREHLDYNQDTINLIKAKLDKAYDEIVGLLNVQYGNISTLEDYLNSFENFGYLNLHDDKTLYLGSIVDKNTISLSNYKYKIFSKYSSRELSEMMFSIDRLGKYSRSYRSMSRSFNGEYGKISSYTNIYHVTKPYVSDRLITAYLKDKHSDFYIVQKKDLNDPINSYGIAIKVISKLVAADPSIMSNDKEALVDYYLSTPTFKLFLELQEEYFNLIRKRTSDYYGVKPSDSFIESRKRKYAKSKDSFIAKIIGYYQRETLKVSELSKYNGRVFYATPEDEIKLRSAYSIFTTLFYDDFNKTFDVSSLFNRNKKSKRKIAFIIVSKSNLKYMKYFRYAHHVDDFYNVMLRRKEERINRFFNAVNINNLFSEFEDVFINRNFTYVDARIGNVVNEVCDYLYNNSIKYSMKTISKELRLFIPEGVEFKLDTQIADKLSLLKELSEKNREVLKYIAVSQHTDITPILADMLRKILVF